MSSLKVQAIGGINKDSGYLIFSPHADLHLQAASLAVEHTEYLLNQIRTKIGNTEFDNFLDLTVTAQKLAGYSSDYTCAASESNISIVLLIALCVSSLLIVEN